LSRVFLDTNLFIYFIEDSGILGQTTADLIERMSHRRDEVVTSVMTLGEVLSKPLNERRFEKALSSPGVSVAVFDHAAARIYAQIRIDKTIKAPDAIQLAVAASVRCDLFVTNDDRLSKKIVPGIQFIAALDRVPI
jgi:predicted nucleic acid-binding protein